MVAFGGVERFKEKTREERGVRLAEDLAGDLRFAFRSLRKSPGVVVVTVLSLGLGIATAYFVSFTILVASFFALTQDNLKRRLAYSTIAQLSYVILGAALLTKSGMIGGIMQIGMHAFGKITLFFCAGSIIVGAHKKNISELSGIGRKMPFTMVAFTIGALSVIGVPPFAGFLAYGVGIWIGLQDLVSVGVNLGVLTVFVMHLLEPRLIELHRVCGNRENTVILIHFVFDFFFDFVL